MGRQRANNEALLFDSHSSLPPVFHKHANSLSPGKLPDKSGFLHARAAGKFPLEWEIFAG